MMKSAGINDGDILIVDRSLDPKDKCVVVASIDCNFEVKKYVENNGNPYLVSEDNPHSAVALSCSEVEIWGIVVFSVHPL